MSLILSRSRVRVPYLCSQCKLQASRLLQLSRRYYSIRTQPKQLSLPASYYRGGTSRGIMFNRNVLPTEQHLWDPIFRGVIGSPDRYARQLDGFGAGVSSLSKICVVGAAPSTSKKDYDVDFTFAQVDTKTEYVDYSGNCGNMLSAVGPFAWDSGIVGRDSVEMYDEEKNEVSVRILNTNTEKIIRCTFPLAEGGKEAAAYGEFKIDGVEGTGPRIRLDFLNPGGSKSGKVLPTGSPSGHLSRSGKKEKENTRFDASFVDVANPFIFLRDEGQIPSINDLSTWMKLKKGDEVLEQLEKLRLHGTVVMGLASNATEAAENFRATPKLVFVCDRQDYQTISGEIVKREDIDLCVRALSMGSPHPALPITAAICTAAAARISGTIVNKEYGATKRETKGGIRIGHPSGVVEVDATVDEEGNVVRGSVYRTARRLMEGKVFWKAEE